VSLAACRHDSTREASVSAPVSDPEAVDTAPVGPDPAPPTKEPRSLTDEQRLAIAVVEQAGGSIAFDADGIPDRIDLAGDRVFADERAARAVLEFPDLRALRLATSSVTADTLAQLATLGQLRELLLQDAAIEDQQLVAVLESLRQLRHLTLRRLSRVTDAGLEVLARCPDLESVALIEMNQMSRASFETLRQVARLRALDLRNCGSLTADDFVGLLSLEGLAEVKLGGPVITDQVLSTIARHRTIRSLVIEDAQITGAWADRLRESADFAQRLRSLSFARCYGVDDRSLLSLPAFPQLETLALRNIMVTGSFLTQLVEAGKAPMPWEHLIVTDAFLTDPSLAALPQLAPALTRLDVRGNLGVTDASVNVLRQLSGLKQVNWEQTGITTTW
jgi:hypothetical protein